MKQDYIKYFRNCGESYTLNDELMEIPESLRDLIREIHDHFNAMPNDWIYKIIYEAFEDLTEQNWGDFFVEPDCYNKQRLDWLYNNSFSLKLCDQAIEEGAGGSLFDIIGNAQWLAKDHIYSAVNDFLEENKIEEATC